MKKVFLLLFMILAFKASSFHIVGGELEFVALEDGRYLLKVIQYFDKAQSDNPGPEPSALVYIYSNRDNAEISRHSLFLVDETFIDYTNPECSIDELVTSRVVWADTVELDPQRYADPEGYYITWERCCRNESIINIRNPGATGMKYTLEIPPLWKDGRRFVNSSPILFKPLSDYACVDQLYYIEFTGTDPDGDSLVYSLAKPLNTSSQTAVPIPQPKPYIEKDYAPGFESVIPGSPSLAISGRGLLTVNPSAAGLYVFSVLVEEYRNGEKIGEVRRDFQMLAIDGCLPPDPPEVGFNIPDNDTFEPEVDTLFYELEEDKCFEFFVTNITNGETINLRAEGVNFDNSIDEIFEFNTSFINPDQDTLRLEVCMPGCPPLGEDPFIVDLIAEDDACPLPQMDTLRLTVVVEPPPNASPQSSAERLGVKILEDSEFSNKILATDPDGDFMDIAVALDGALTPEEIGLRLTIDTSYAGGLEATLEWNTDCQIYNFTEDTSFRVKIEIDDIDICDNPTEFLILDYEVELPPNTRPVISLLNSASNQFDIDQNESVDFDLRVEDTDGDEVQLILANGDALRERYGIVFKDTSGLNGLTGSRFSWFADCDLMEEGQVNRFEFKFIADDFDKCKVKNYDTLDVVVNVFSPVNTAPVLENYPDYVLEVNELFTMDISAADEDVDTIFLEFSPNFNFPSSETLIFPETSGIGSVSQQLRWRPECSLLRNGQPTLYDLIFVTYDQRCPVAKQDTTLVTFLIQETRNSFNEFKPPNAFSPNGDGYNELFTMSGFTDKSNNLPIDNCDDQFQYISIHDRSGKKVFYSESRDFSWDGGNLPPGVYYYLVKYTVTEYRNYIQILK